MYNIQCIIYTPTAANSVSDVSSGLKLINFAGAASSEENRLSRWEDQI